MKTQLEKALSVSNATRTHISFQNDKNNHHVARTVYIELVSHFNHGGKKSDNHKVEVWDCFL